MYLLRKGSKYTAVFLTINNETVRNKLDGKCYKDVLNKTYILILVLSNKTINICANTTFEQVMVNI